MASVDGARSVKVSSEESFQHECTPCQNDDVIKEAKFYCTECRDYLCESCDSSHKRFRSTRSHNVVLCTDLEVEAKESEVISRPGTCPCSRNEATTYCKDHQEAFCVDCKTLKHKHCETVSVDQIVDDLEQDFDNATLHRTAFIRDKIMKLQNNRKQALEKLSDETISCISSIEEQKMKFIEHLNKLEDSVLKDLCKHRDAHKDILDQDLAVYNTALRALNSEKRSYQVSKHTDSRREIFINHLKLTQTLNDLDAILGNIDKDAHDPRLLFEMNQELSMLFSISSFGILTHNMLGHSKSFSPDLNVYSCKKVDIRVPSDQKAPWISGSVFLPSGDIVLCDRNNNTLKVFDCVFGAKNSFILSENPRDCCCVADNVVAVSFPEAKMIQIYETAPTLKLKTAINLDKCCPGVAALKSEIYVVCHSSPDKEIRVLDQEGNLKRQIILNEPESSSFKAPYYIAVGISEEMYISETDENLSSQVRSFTKNGVCRYKFSDSQLKTAAGMFPSKDGCLLVSFWKNNMVRLIEHNGKNSRDFFTPDGTISQPYSISFRENDATLVITMRDTDEMLVYKLK